MKKLVIALAVLLVLAGAAAAVLPLAETYLADRVRSEIERGGTVTVRSAEIGLLDRRITLNEVRPVRPDGGLSAERWQISGMSWPLDEILHGRTPLSGFRLGDPVKAGKVEVDKLQVAMPDGERWSFGKLILEDVDLARFDPTVPPGTAQFAVLSARIVAALKLRHFEEHDVIYTLAHTGDTAGFKLLSGDTVDRGLFGAIKLASFEATGKAASEPAFSMAELTAENLDLRKVVAGMSQAGWQPGRPVGRLYVDRSGASGFGGELLRRYGVSLGGITTVTTHEGSEVSHSTTKVEGFVLSPPLRGMEGLQLRLALQAMGLKDLRLDLTCAGTEDRGKGELSVDRCSLVGAELGTVDLSGRLTNADAAFWRVVDGGNALALRTTKAALSEARLVIADKGMVERSMRALSLTTSQSSAATRANMALQIRRYAPPDVMITEDMTKLLDTVAKFIEQGGTLTIEAKPVPPLGVDKLRYLSRPGPDLVRALGLSATLSR
ncbi:MAG: hypothetical protein JSR24_17655 [Proteobacteria bacterium]|nr:hypothetical protein [Pseudomonadota bacterium]